MPQRSPRAQRPNIVLILNDDMGFSDLDCYGGEIHTPNLNRLAAGGLRYTQFYNTARCCPSRASLLTGLHPHQADVGHMMGDDGADGYRGDLSLDAVTMAELLRTAGYRTYMSGKWHVTRHLDPAHAGNWPCQRGFDRFFGIITGAANYWKPNSLTRDNTPVCHEDLPPGFFLTDAISDEASAFLRAHSADSPDSPFFLYAAYTAPHWPLHAHEDDIARYRGRFAAGWDQLRRERLERMRKLGILEECWRLSDRDPSQPPWSDADHREWQQRRMEVYAAQIDRMDRGIGRILDTLAEIGQTENTLIVFLADNGGCAEELWPGKAHPMHAWPAATQTTSDGRIVMAGNDPSLMPGPESTYQSYGVPWANLSNTPFRLYKHWVHEGGIATPFIVHWPAGISSRGELRRQPAQLPDVLATFAEVAGAEYPSVFNGRPVPPCEGFSMTPTFSGGAPARDVLYWEHEGNKAVRKGRWKLVCRFPGKWELYDLVADRSELDDLAGRHPDIVRELTALYDRWATRCKVMPWEQLLEMRRARQAARG
ncbi:MAG: arylsulfatase [Kiritimatiellaeota bacterium]|nr:arylsulfatase [Kiritimatiellota bacterium]